MGELGVPRDHGSRLRPLGPLRSMLFVPGHKTAWVDKALSSGADAIILDLEDAVAASDRSQARMAARESVCAIATTRAACFVRVNRWGAGGALLADLHAVVCPGLDGVVLPKVTGPTDIAALSRLLGELEATRGAARPIEIVPLCETAAAIDLRPAIYAASLRVRRAPVGAFGSPGGDAARSIGLLQTSSGDETAYLLGRAILEARAAGLVGVLGGMSTTVHDLAEVERVARRSRQFGANGALAIHPSHVAVLHEVFTPGRDEIEDAAEIVMMFRQRQASGDPDTAGVHRGRMVDLADLRTALDLVSDAATWGPPVSAGVQTAAAEVLTWLDSWPTGPPTGLAGR
jgi:citrate lyase subunit beta / citryl-CoA lyase